MMKLKTLLMCVIPTLAIAHAQNDELLVAERLVRMIMSSPEWNDDVVIEETDDGDDDRRRIRFDNYEELFTANFPTGTVGCTWTPSERMTAFENFVAKIPELSTNGAYRAIGTHGDVAMEYCCERNASNVLIAAMRILMSEHSVAKGSALKSLRKFAIPDAMINRIASAVLTNGVSISPAFRIRVLGAYADLLARRRLECNPQSFTNGVSLIMSSVVGCDGAIPADKMLLESYPDYGMSSNRLELAISALNGRFASTACCSSAVEKYFIPITNRLTSSSAPLAEVKELRNLRLVDEY